MRTNIFAKGGFHATGQVTRNGENPDRGTPPPVEHKAPGEQTVPVDRKEPMTETTPEAAIMADSAEEQVTELTSDSVRFKREKRDD